MPCRFICIDEGVLGLGNACGMSGAICEVLGTSEGIQGVLEGVRGAQGSLWEYVPFNFLHFKEVTNEILDIFQLTWRSQMS